MSITPEEFFAKCNDYEFYWLDNDAFIQLFKTFVGWTDEDQKASYSKNPKIYFQKKLIINKRLLGSSFRLLEYSLETSIDYLQWELMIEPMKNNVVFKEALDSSWSYIIECAHVALKLQNTYNNIKVCSLCRKEHITITAYQGTECLCTQCLDTELFDLFKTLYDAEKKVSNKNETIQINKVCIVRTKRKEVRKRGH